jgi:mannosyltransferase OCH1-like enzyme
MKLLNHYSKSSYKNRLLTIINAGTSNDNIKIIKLSQEYINPKFYPRKFKDWPDEFEIILLDENLLKIRRSDVIFGGWGETLIIDVEYDNEVINLEILPEQKIPRIIYQTFESFECCENMYNSIQSWKDLNVEYEHYYFDNKKIIEFIEKYFDKSVLNSYLTLIPGAFKADLWRCCILYISGGVYIDADTVCLSPLRDYILVNDVFVVPRDDPMSKSYLWNGFIASTPKHPFLKKQIDKIVSNVESRKKCYYLDISGPGLLGKSVNEVIGRNIDSEYELGENIINDHNFKILFHDWKTMNIKLQGENGNPVILTEYPNKKEDMKKINNISYYELYLNDCIYQIIPREIYYTTKDILDINIYMVNSFKNKNIQWNLNYYNDEDIIEFIVNNNTTFINDLNVDILSYYLTLSNGGEKADLWRYCVIYLMGGVYTDSDTYCNIELDNWIKHHDLILGIEAFLDLDFAKGFGMDKIGYCINNKVISVCNWTFAASPKHPFFKKLLQDICLNPIYNNVLNNTGPGRFTKHAIKYFTVSDLLLLENQNIIKNKSILYSINKFGSNQTHSNAYKNFENPFDCKRHDVYIIHRFDGNWRYSYHNKKIKTYKTNLGVVSHNLTILKNKKGFLGVSRLDKDTSRTKFMECIGDCRTLLEYQFDNDFNILSETECEITNIIKHSKFEDFRFFTFNNSYYIAVSYIDINFNTKVAILDNTYKYLGDVNTDLYNNVSFMNKKVIWEKNWLFFEKSKELYFIYSTTPNYILYKCVNFLDLKFVKVIDIIFPLENDVPDNEKYFTSYIGSDIKISTGGSTNPIYIKEKDVYFYLIHTKINNKRRYNHYGVLLNKDLIPIKLFEDPIFNSEIIHYIHFFIMSIEETENYLIFSGGINDEINFIWEIAKEKFLQRLTFK